MWYMQPSNRGGWPKGWYSKWGGSRVSAPLFPGNCPPARKVRMSDNETRDGRAGRAPLSLKKTETSTVKQSFSHGRTKAVVVEKKRARVTPGGKPEAPEPA